MSSLNALLVFSQHHHFAVHQDLTGNQVKYGGKSAEISLGKFHVGLPLCLCHLIDCAEFEVIAATLFSHFICYQLWSRLDRLSERGECLVKKFLAYKLSNRDTRVMGCSLHRCDSIRGVFWQHRQVLWTSHQLPKNKTNNISFKG
jgi:hypothetical protein